MAEAYGVSGSSLSKIARWFNARKAAGQTVQPWEYESVVNAEMDSLGKQRTANRSLSLQQKSLDLQAARDAENVKQTAINNDLTREQIDASKSNSTKGVIGTGLGLYFTRAGAGKEGTPGAMDNVGETLSKIGTNAKKVGTGLWNTVRGNSTAGAVSSGTTTPLVEGTGGGVDSYGASEGVGVDLGNSGTPLEGTKTTAQTVSDYAVPVAGGFIGEKLTDATGLGEKTSEVMPFGGRKDWDRAAGAGVAAGLASLAGVNPLYAAAGYLGASIGLDSLF